MIYSLHWNSKKMNKQTKKEIEKRMANGWVRVQEGRIKYIEESTRNLQTEWTKVTKKRLSRS